MANLTNFSTVGSSPFSGGRQGVDNQRLSRVPAARIQLPQGRFTSGGNSLRSPRSAQGPPTQAGRVPPPPVPQIRRTPATTPPRPFQPRFQVSSPFRSQGSFRPNVNLQRFGFSGQRNFNRPSPFISNNLRFR